VEGSFTFHNSAEIDLLITLKRIGFEYQGQRHFFDCNVLGEVEVTENRDETKIAFCCFNNIALIEVPFWWNNLESTLRQTIDRVVSARS